MTEAPQAIDPAVLEVIRTAVRAVKGPTVGTAEITPATGLWSSEDPDAHSLYLDSLDLLEIVVFIETERGWTIEEDQIDAAGWQTVGDLATTLTRARVSEPAAGNDADGY
jgi:hypothetical protein